MNTLQSIERENLRRDLPPFRSGDTVRVHVRIKEGDKTRTQVFEGVVLRRHGSGKSATFTVRKMSYGVGVERIFLCESPNVEKVEIKARGHVRRSRLYYLRDLRGKKARLRSKVRDVSDLVSEEELEARNAPAEEEVIEEEPAANEENTSEEAPSEETAEEASEEEAAAAESEGEKSEE